MGLCMVSSQYICRLFFSIVKGRALMGRIIRGIFFGGGRLCIGGRNGIEISRSFRGVGRAVSRICGCVSGGRGCGRLIT